MSSCIINEMGVKTWYKGIKFFLSFFPSNFFVILLGIWANRAARGWLKLLEKTYSFFFSFYVEKFLSDTPVVGQFCKKCLYFDSNQLTLRIGPFGDFQKIFFEFRDKKFNLETVTYLEIRFSDFDETFRMSSPQYGLSKSEDHLT